MPDLAECQDFLWKRGAAEGTRTPDPIITNDVLYQLSYSGTFPSAVPDDDSLTAAAFKRSGPVVQGTKGRGEGLCAGEMKARRGQAGALPERRTGIVIGSGPALLHPIAQGRDLSDGGDRAPGTSGWGKAIDGLSADEPCFRRPQVQRVSGAVFRKCPFYRHIARAMGGSRPLPGHLPPERRAGRGIRPAAAATCRQGRGAPQE